jgi:hypothetical protein
VTFDNSFFDNSFDLVRPLKNRSFFKYIKKPKLELIELNEDNNYVQLMFCSTSIQLEKSLFLFNLPSSRQFSKKSWSASPRVLYDDDVINKFINEMLLHHFTHLVLGNFENIWQSKVNPHLPVCWTMIVWLSWVSNYLIALYYCDIINKLMKHHITNLTLTNKT